MKKVLVKLTPKDLDKFSHLWICNVILLFRDHSATIEITSSASETADLSFFWRALIFQAEGKRGRSGLAATGALSHAVFNAKGCFPCWEVNFLFFVRSVDSAQGSSYSLPGEQRAHFYSKMKSLFAMLAQTKTRETFVSPTMSHNFGLVMMMQLEPFAL